MHRLSKWFVVLVFVLAFGWAASEAQAAPATDTHTIRFVYWPTSVTMTESSCGCPMGRWNAGLWGVDYRFRYDDHWGLQLQYLTGSATGGTGGSIGLNSATDRMWNVNLVYEVRNERIAARLFAGWGNLRSVGDVPCCSWRELDHSGVRFGFDTAMSLTDALSLNFGLAVMPFANSNLGLDAFRATAASTAFEWFGGVAWQITPAIALEGGYRFADVSVGSNTLFEAFHQQWSGAYVSLVVSLP